MFLSKCRQLFGFARSFFVQAPNDGKTCARCMIRGARAAKGAPSWQDLRAVHPRTPVCGAFRMHGAHILPKPAHFGYMAAICCRELALFPSEAPSGTHEAKKLPRIAARKHAAARSCHCRTPGNAFREHFATGKRPGTHHGIILPRLDARPASHGTERPTAPAGLIAKHHAMHRTRRFCRY